MNAPEIDPTCERCQKHPFCRGMCRICYKRWWRAQKRPPQVHQARNPFCSVCGERAVSKGLCRSHYQQQWWRKIGRFLPINPINQDTRHSLDGRAALKTFCEAFGCEPKELGAYILELRAQNLKN